MKSERNFLPASFLLKKWLFFASVVLLAFLAAGCENFWEVSQNDDDDVDCSTYNYSDCQTREPSEAALLIDLTINDENPAVPLVVYKGDYDENHVVAIDTAYDIEHEIYVTLDNYYSVAAKYKVGEKNIIAIDGDEIAKYSEEVCDSTCWSVTGGFINVELKNFDEKN